jgi:acyl-coenzyme A synthetase/AMP-(fatty) acid ligase
MDKPNPDLIRQFSRKQIVKAPKTVEFVESLPKNPQGKILKREIRAKYWK